MIQIHKEEASVSNKPFKPYIPANQNLQEISFKSIFLGIIMAVILGVANAYLGLMAGMTVAATFPAAVISMAIIRPLKGEYDSTLDEAENFALS